jgi:NADPH-dependent curcumin reductase CurA
VPKCASRTATRRDNDEGGTPKCSDTDSYIPRVELGTVMRSSGIGEVIASNHADFAVGDSDEKAGWIINELGFDGVVNYKVDDLGAKLDELAPDGVDVYFENTGGPIQNAVFERMNAHGRIVVCGMIADYTSANPSPDPNWMRIIKKRLKIQGFTMPDHMHKAGELQAKLAPYVQRGQVKYRTHVLEGLESAMGGLSLFLTGDNKGKLMVRL